MWLLLKVRKPLVSKNTVSAFHTQRNHRASSCKFRLYPFLFLFWEPLLLTPKASAPLWGSEWKRLQSSVCVCTGESLWVPARACQGSGLNGSAVRLIYWRTLDSPVGFSGISQRLHEDFCWRFNVRMVFVCVSVFLEGMLHAKASDPPLVQRVKLC